MKKNLLFKITAVGRKSWSPFYQGCEEMRASREIKLESCECEKSERDVIKATLWDDLASLDIHTGDLVLVTLRFYVTYPWHTPPYEQRVEVVNIKKVIDYQEKQW